MTLMDLIAPSSISIEEGAIKSTSHRVGSEHIIITSGSEHVIITSDCCCKWYCILLYFTTSNALSNRYTIPRGYNSWQWDMWNTTSADVSWEVLP